LIFLFFQAAKLPSNQSLVNANKLGKYSRFLTTLCDGDQNGDAPLFLVPWHLTACFIAK
jgi:hypothetical protein